MLVDTVVQVCRDCNSDQIVKNGHNACGNQQYLSKACASRKVLHPTVRSYSASRQAEILRAYQERSSLRGVCRTFGISRSTLTRWLKKNFQTLPEVSESLSPAQP